jgi:hypothetical protein
MVEQRRLLAGLLQESSAGAIGRGPWPTVCGGGSVLLLATRSARPWRARWTRRLALLLCAAFLSTVPPNHNLVLEGGSGGSVQDSEPLSGLDDSILPCCVFMRACTLPATTHTTVSTVPPIESQPRARGRLRRQRAGLGATFWSRRLNPALLRVYEGLYLPSTTHTTLSTVPPNHNLVLEGGSGGGVQEGFSGLDDSVPGLLRV